MLFCIANSNLFRIFAVSNKNRRANWIKPAKTTMSEIKTYKGIRYELANCHFQETMNFGWSQTICYCKIGDKAKTGDEREIRLFITRELQHGKATTKEIVKTLRTCDTTQICRLYKRVFGEVPTEESWVYVDGVKVTYKHLDGFAVYQWAKDYATSRRMNRALYECLDRASHKWKYSVYDEPYRHAPHGLYEPLLKQYIVNELLKHCQDPTSNYAKRPMYGHTHLYFCSPVYGHADYNKWRAIPIQGNERFCELVVRYADKFFND